MDLLENLVELAAVPDDELEAKGRNLYKQLYLNRGRFGIHSTHDSEEVVFHEDRFDHAFYARPDKWAATKDYRKPERNRLERIRWIGAVIAGRVAQSECWEAPSPTGRRRPPNRVYIVWQAASSYVVWLEPRQNGGWKFSTAYETTPGGGRDYRRGGRCIWRQKKDAP